MKNIVNNYKKGQKVQFGENEAIITSDLMKFKDYYAIYADVIKNNENIKCATVKIHDKIALIIRDKQILEDMGLDVEERKAIYCHELGHNFSSNQSKIEDKRNIAYEVDSDTFAVEKCGIDPYVLESALKKTYEYDIQNLKNKANMTQERLDKYVNEMKARKENIKRLILKKEKNEMFIR